MDNSTIAAFVKSPRFVPILAGIGFIIIAIVIFEAGVAVGFHKAEFAGQWEENYARNFGGPPDAFGLPATDVPNPHGAFGEIVSVTLPTFAISGGAEAEKVVKIGDDTIIRDGATTIAPGDLSSGEYVIVIGDPSASGTVAAKLIRVMPPPPDAQTNSK